MKHISILGVLMATLLLIHGCMKDDKDECKSELLLRFRYTLNDQSINLFDAEVHKVTVYVFDKAGKYVGSFSEHGGQLTNDYIMRIPLPHGEYSVIVYGGNFSTYSVGDPGLLATLRTELKSVASGDGFLYPLSVPDDLYAGFTHHVSSTLNNKYVTDVDLIKTTKKIKVKLSGVDSPQVHITSTNGKYLYDNSIDSSHGIFKYIASNSSTEGDYLLFDLKTMRLMLDTPSRLVIIDPVTLAVLYDENIIDLILATGQYTTQQDLDREDEFVFTIKIGHDISVWINGWQISDMHPDDM